jgi:hypothetical protein
VSASRAWRARLFLLGLCLLSTYESGARDVAPRAGSRAAAEQLRRASDHFRAGRYAEARELFDRVLAANAALPERGTIAFNAAVSSYALEAYADALARFDAVAASVPKLAGLASVNAGFAALKLGELDVAEARARAAAAGDASLEARRSQLLAELEQARQARSAAELTRSLDDGFAAISREQWQPARDQLTRALAIPSASPDDRADAHYGLGVVATALGDPRRAEQHFEQSLALRPGDARTTLALARAAEEGADRRRAEAAYESALGLALEPAQAEDAQRSLFRLYPLPATGAAALLSLGVGADGNAAQSGSSDVLGGGGEARTSAFVSGLVELSLALRASRRSAIGLRYAGDLLALTDPSVRDLSLQSHELLARYHWAPVPGARLRLDAGAAYLLSGLDPIRSFEWDGVLALSLELDTSAHSRARLQLGERLVRATELSYLDGHRLQALASELWSLGSWELSVQAGLRYHGAGVQEIELAGDAFAACSPNCDRGRYQNPLSYWSPAAGVGASWQATEALRFSTQARLEYRGYLEQSSLPGARASRKTRQDTRLRGQLGAELELDAAGRFRLTLDQTLLVSRSNVAYAADDPAHQYDYGDRNFVQPTTELGVSASLP